MKDPKSYFHIEAIDEKNPEFFVGRGDQIRKAVSSLTVKERAVAIFGQRGVGKTSFARQVASILENNNPRFSWSSLGIDRGNSAFVSIYPTFLRMPVDVPNLLSALLEKSAHAHSLYSKARYVYESESVNKEFVDMFGFGLKELDRTKLAGVDPYRFFDEFILAAKRINDNATIVYFIDEAETLKDRTGLGRLIKNMSNSSFVVIGIADTLSELIDDHPSVSRKLFGGDIEVPLFRDKEIADIFSLAEEKSNGELRIDGEFVSLAKKASRGFPWIAQNVGLEAAKIVFGRRGSEDRTARIRKNQFGAAWSAFERIYGSMTRINPDYTLLERPEALAVCQRMCSSSSYLTISEIERQVPSDIKRDVQNIVQRLEAAGFAYKRPDGLYRFVDPILQVIVMKRIGMIDFEREEQ